MRKVNVASVQMRCGARVEDNLERAEALVRQAAKNGANVILLPELFERPYFCQERQYGYYHYAKTVDDNEAVLHFSRVAKELGVVIPVSFYELDGMQTFNSVAVLDGEGKNLGIYRKTHIPLLSGEILFYAGRYRISGFPYLLWNGRNRYLLGSVVP